MKRETVVGHVDWLVRECVSDNFEQSSSSGRLERHHQQSNFYGISVLIVVDVRMYEWAVLADLFRAMSDTESSKTTGYYN